MRLAVGLFILGFVVSARSARAQSAAAQDALSHMRVVEVEIPWRGGEAIAATLALPVSGNAVPAVVLIPGYVLGARPRDEDEFRNPGEDTGRLLEKFFCERGLAVLHVPIGGGPGGNEPSISASDLADRELQCVAYLQSRPEIDRHRVGIVGQSVGGFFAVMAAARSADVAFVVTLATPAESIDHAFLDALDRVLAGSGAPEAERQSLHDMMKSIFAAAANGATADELRPRLEQFFRREYQWLPKQARQAAGKDADEFVDRVLEEHLADSTSPMFRSLVGYDFTQTLSEIRCPALVLFAERDFKVEPQRSARMAREALTKTKSTTREVQIIAEADHFFRATDGNLSTGLQDALTKWLGAHVESAE